MDRRACETLLESVPRSSVHRSIISIRLDLGPPQWTEARSPPRPRPADFPTVMVHDIARGWTGRFGVTPRATRDGRPYQAVLRRALCAVASNLAQLHRGRAFIAAAGSE